TAVVVGGTLDNRDGGGAGWDAEIAMPWAAAKGKDDAMAIHVPPQLGDVWRLNVVRSEMPKDGKQTAASWNRITCADFHALDRMLAVQFADRSGSTKQVAVPEGTGTGSGTGIGTGSSSARAVPVPVPDPKSPTSAPSRTPPTTPP